MGDAKIKIILILVLSYPDFIAKTIPTLPTPFIFSKGYSRMSDRIVGGANTRRNLYNSLVEYFAEIDTRLRTAPTEGMYDDMGDLVRRLITDRYGEAIRGVINETRTRPWWHDSAVSQAVKNGFYERFLDHAERLMNIAFGPDGGPDMVENPISRASSAAAAAPSAPAAEEAAASASPAAAAAAAPPRPRVAFAPLPAREAAAAAERAAAQIAAAEKTGSGRMAGGAVENDVTRAYAARVPKTEAQWIASVKKFNPAAATPANYVKDYLTPWKKYNEQGIMNQQPFSSLPVAILPGYTEVRSQAEADALGPGAKYAIRNADGSVSAGTNKTTAQLDYYDQEAYDKQVMRENQKKAAEEKYWEKQGAVSRFFNRDVVGALTKVADFGSDLVGAVVPGVGKLIQKGYQGLAPPGSKYYSSAPLGQKLLNTAASLAPSPGRGSELELTVSLEALLFI